MRIFAYVGLIEIVSIFSEPMQTVKAGLSADSPSLLSHVRSGVTALSSQCLWKSVWHAKAPGVLAGDRDVGLQGSSTGRLVGKVLLLLEGSPDLSHISTFSCFCAKTRPCICCTVHQGNQVERNAGNLTLHLPCCCCCCDDIFMEVPQPCSGHPAFCSQSASLVSSSHWGAGHPAHFFSSWRGICDVEHAGWGTK